MFALRFGFRLWVNITFDSSTLRKGGRYESVCAKSMQQHSLEGAKGQANIVDEDASPIPRGCIDFIWGKYKGFTGAEFARCTHSEGAGWHFAIQRNDAIISMEDMMNDKTV